MTAKISSFDRKIYEYLLEHANLDPDASHLISAENWENLADEELDKRRLATQKKIISNLPSDILLSIVMKDTDMKRLVELATVDRPIEMT